jgi:cellulose synthase/poly-beta-1,6-N-acetylglucosamine synthase-like glycosyltransferase
VPIPNNTIADDLVLPLLGKLRHNGRIVYDQMAIGTEETPPTIGDEFRRRVRIGIGAFQSVPLLWRLLSPRYGWTAFAFLSHKLLRWMGPFFLLGMLVSSTMSLDRTSLRWMLAAQVAAYAAAVAGMYLPNRGLPRKLLRALTMFVAMNLALLVGFCRWLTSRQTGIWHRTSRNCQPQTPEPPILDQPHPASWGNEQARHYTSSHLMTEAKSP